MDYGSAASDGFTARIVSFGKLKARELSLLARDCGLEISQDNSDFLPPKPAGNNPHKECLLIDFSSIMDWPMEELGRLSSYIGSGSAKAFVWTDLDGLEAAFALFPPAMCHFLVDTSNAEAMTLLTTETRRGIMDQLHDQSRDEGYDELHKISNDLANVARSLSQIVGKDGEDGEGPQKNAATQSPVNIAYDSNGGPAGQLIADKPVTFRPAANAADPKPSNFTRADSIANSENGLTPRYIRNIIKLRRLRERHFDADLFADPAWDILLDLMAARLEKNPVSVSSLCIAASVPPTTALRWITTMVKNGLLERRQDPNDARRVFLELSDNTANSIEDYFKRAATMGSQVI